MLHSSHMLQYISCVLLAFNLHYKINITKLTNQAITQHMSELTLQVTNVNSVHNYATKANVLHAKKEKLHPTHKNLQHKMYIFYNLR